MRPRTTVKKRTQWQFAKRCTNGVNLGHEKLPIHSRPLWHVNATGVNNSHVSASAVTPIALLIMLQKVEVKNTSIVPSSHPAAWTIDDHFIPSTCSLIIAIVLLPLQQSLPHSVSRFLRQHTWCWPHRHPFHAPSL